MPTRECVAGLTRSELAALGARYLELAGPYRKTGRPYFIDKRPSNWLEAGLISMILPHARIIDIRREPMAACFAMYKQILPGEASFSYELAELGRHYNEYVDMMRHYETVLPGRIHFLQYELLVEDTETENPPPAGILRSAVRRALPAFLGNRPYSGHAERRAGAPPDIS
ncbi:MAG: sulfotransferase [Rhodospirillales bacterium]